MVTQISFGPRMLDFGKVSAASRNVRYLSMHNPLLQSVHVVLALAQYPEIKNSQPVSQVGCWPLPVQLAHSHNAADHHAPHHHPTSTIH